MTIKDTLAQGLNKLIDRAGTQFVLTRYTQVIGSVWDDEVTLTQDSQVWTSGIELPIDAREGSDDSVLVTQGKLIDGDIKMFMHGSLFLVGSGLQITVGLNGSPDPSRRYAPIPIGMIGPKVENQRIYRKVYLRELTNGSLLGQWLLK